MIQISIIRTDNVYMAHYRYCTSLATVR